MNRYSIEIAGGRTLFLYAPTLPDAEAKARSRFFEPLPGQTKYVGAWDPDRGCILGDPTKVVIEGDVHARPQKKK